MKTARIFLVLLVFSGAMFLLSTCKKGTDENKITHIVKNKLSGYVQKGPYINGTSILMYELDASLGQTGKNFSTQINDNKGSFEINNVTLSSQYVEFLADGYYFNEIVGNISTSQLSLYALSDITNLSTVNVNILTHLEKGRVESLVGKGLTFTAAKDTAQKEVLAIFGLQANNMDRSEELDISVDNQGNAILLAISLILQGNRSVGELTELLANISTDIQQDGKLDNAGILANLRNSTLELDLAGIRTNLQNRYKDLGDNTTIPGFEPYINNFLIATGGLLPEATTGTATNILTTTATLTGTANASNLSTIVTFEYGTSSDYGSSVTASQSPITGNTNITVSANITGLSLGTTYYFRTKVSSSAGTKYGTQVSFTTNNVPTLSTTEISLITGTSSTSGGNISSDGGAPITVKGICWNTSGSPTVSDITTNVGSGTDSFTGSLTGLTIGTTYYVRAYATNSIGTGYGTELIFTTLNIPSLTTSAASLITLNTAIGGGNVINDGGATVTARGICWSTITGPTIDLNSNTSEAGNVGTFTSQMTGLSMGTTYYVRAYASNNVGTQYGDEIVFKTQTSGTVTDIEGNVYKTITIGDQDWMAENLKVTKFDDNTEIPFVTSNDIWATSTKPAYSWYANDVSFKDNYGALYNWYTVDNTNNGNKNVCPTGWHVTSDAEWTTLTDYLRNNGYVYEHIGNDIAKSMAATSGWNTIADPGRVGNDQAGNNSSGFTALPAGQRVDSGPFTNIGIVGWWWCSPEGNPEIAWDRGIEYGWFDVGRYTATKATGYSVRCLKDN
jgi:uncharacterized protein (TIGR02145 family)